MQGYLDIDVKNSIIQKDMKRIKKYLTLIIAVCFLTVLFLHISHSFQCDACDVKRSYTCLFAKIFSFAVTSFTILTFILSIKYVFIEHIYLYDLPLVLIAPPRAPPIIG